GGDLVLRTELAEVSLKRAASDDGRGIFVASINEVFSHLHEVAEHVSVDEFFHSSQISCFDLSEKSPGDANLMLQSGKIVYEIALDVSEHLRIDLVAARRSFNCCQTASP